MTWVYVGSLGLTWSTAAKLAGNLVNYCIVVYGVYITMWGPYCLTNCMY